MIKETENAFKTICKIEDSFDEVRDKIDEFFEFKMEEVKKAFDKESREKVKSVWGEVKSRLVFVEEDKEYLKEGLENVSERIESIRSNLNGVLRRIDLIEGGIT